MKESSKVIGTDMGTERLCVFCGEYWPLDDEFWNKRGNGYHSYCKACMTERKAELRSGSARKIRSRIKRQFN
jgi:hypothetical protein